MTPCVLYLDTSDLSYLARGEVVRGVSYGSLRKRITGLRVGEIRALDWKRDADLEAKAVNKQIRHGHLTLPKEGGVWCQ